MDYGFGVDENTALMVSAPDKDGTAHLTVKGAGGVFIVDLRRATFGNKTTETLFSVRNSTAHYLLAGDSARIDRTGRLFISLSASRPLLPTSPDEPVILQDRVLDYGSSNFLRLATTMGQKGANRGWGSTLNSNDKRSHQDAPLYAVMLSRRADTRFRGVQLSKDSADSSVSYMGLHIQISPCDDQCLPPADFSEHN
jgi:hypothetical protein